METLDKHFRNLTRAAFARYGFAYGDVITHWPDIVGAELARHSRPDRIKWPRGTAEGQTRNGGTLVISAAPGRALDLQYEVPRIIERINGYYGYGAISAVKVMQAASGFSAPAPAPVGPLKTISDPALEAISDEGLKAALIRLGQGVAGGRTGSPQGK